MWNRNRREKEWKLVEKQEEKIRKKAFSKEVLPWKKTLEEKVPAGVQERLAKEFGRAFSIVLKKGTAVIEKTYNKEDIKVEHEVQDYAVSRKGGRKEFRNLHKTAKKANQRNMLITTAEGIGLGVLGIGLPDIVLFTGMLLKGIYETALSYGFDYENPVEQMRILKMIEVAVSKGADWELLNEQLEKEWSQDVWDIPTDEMRKEQIMRTANALAMDMVFLKFVQGLPVVGVIGGAGNPVYYDKILRYVQVKYKKHYLMK